MLIAICDDEVIFRDNLKAILRRYKTAHRVHIDICEFATGEELLSCGDVFDMVFLDYQMPGLNGMDAARALRLKNTVCSIVFVTGYPQFVLESFEVQPYRFFVKPLEEKTVDLLMNTFIAHQNLLSPLTVINDDEQKIIAAQDVLYLEADGKCCIIRTLNDTYRSSKTLAQVHQLLPQHCFYRPHKSYVINLYCIDSFTNSYISLTNGERVKLARQKIGEFHRVFADFIKNYYIKV